MKSIELFAGAGGLGIGLELAGFEHLMVIDNDRWACDTLKENTHWPLVSANVEGYSYKNFAGKVDLVSGGPPCQPFSLGGRHRAHSDNRNMFPEAIRAVRELQPKAFIFENVKGLTRTKFANYLEYIRLQLRRPELNRKQSEEWHDHLCRLERHETSGLKAGLKYNVIIRVLNAANFGVPQKRERVFIVGFRSDLMTEWAFPLETHSYNALLWDKWRSGDYWERHKIAKRKRPKEGRGKSHAMRLGERPSLLPWQTLRDAISDLPDPEFHPVLAEVYPDHRFIPGARSYPGHTGSPLDQPSKTLKAGVHGVPGGENMLRRPNGTIRYFTVRESARLQDFPDDFLFHGSWTETMRQLGNAVPVNLAKAVGESVRVQLK